LLHSDSDVLEKGIFRGLSPDERRALIGELDRMPVKRGDVLIRQGDPADSIYFVVSGRFEVRLNGRAEMLAEIGAGSPIGEIAFLAGGLRSANVIAARDGLVLRLRKAEFDQLCQRMPQIWTLLTIVLADRLEETDAAINHGRVRGERPPRVVTLVPAGPEPIPEQFTAMLAAELGRFGRILVLTARNLPAFVGDVIQVSSIAATEALNSLEERYDTILNVADDTLTPWSRKAIHQADVVLLVGKASAVTRAPVPLNEQECFVAKLLSADGQRLVLIHDQRQPPLGTRHWLDGRKVRMHHHVALTDAADVERLVRFMRGTALGLVACGGGALCASHIGLYKAFIEAGVCFDIMGGTSGGSAMAGAFAMGLDPEEIDRLTHDIFITNRALRRYTWPRYSLVDHTHFDRLLAQHYAGIDIEDLWIPYFAVSTNLSRYSLHRHTSGDLWQAIRASSSIPGLLPPFYTEDGQMLVDGSLLDNVPVRSMHEMKSGPNIVVAFKVPHLDRFAVDYNALPSRMEFFTRVFRPFKRQPLPSAPGLASVLLRSLLVNSHSFEQHLAANDLLMVPPLPEKITILDWDRHGELMTNTYQWGKDELERLSSDPPEALAGSREGRSPAIARVIR